MPFCPLLYMFLSLSLFPPSLRFQPQDARKGYTALYWASWYGHTDVVKLLLRGGADKNIAEENGWTPLMRAKHFGRQAIVALLQ